MTIFDTIKYPISEPPTKAELSALPDNLYAKWQSSIGLSFAPGMMVIIYATCRNSASCKRDTTILRKMISEYDNI